MQSAVIRGRQFTMMVLRYGHIGRLDREDAVESGCGIVSIFCVLCGLCEDEMARAFLELALRFAVKRKGIGLLLCASVLATTPSISAEYPQHKNVCLGLSLSPVRR